MDESEAALPTLARQALRGLAGELHALDTRVAEIEAVILAWHKESEVSRRLATIPGIGPITASAIVATVGDAAQFGSARQLAAWIGLVPKQNSSGGKQRRSGISKQGDRYLRRLLVLGATALIRHARTKATPQAAWIRQLLERRPAKLVAVALANKTARIAWAVLAKRADYRASVPAPAA
jgi:transposase